MGESKAGQNWEVGGLLSVSLWDSPNVTLQMPLLSAVWCHPPGWVVLSTIPALFVLYLSSKQEASSKLTQPELSLTDRGLETSSPFISWLLMPLWPEWVSDGGFQTLSQGQGRGFGHQSTEEGSGMSVADGREGGDIWGAEGGGSSGEASHSPHMKNHYSNLFSRNSNSLEPNSDLN